MHELLTVLGLLGSALVVFAYFANLRGALDAIDWRYSLLNLVGAGLILLSLAETWNLAAAVVEGFWAAISVWGLYHALITRRDKGDA